MFVAGGMGELIKGYFYRRIPIFVGITLLMMIGLIFGALSVQTLGEVQRQELAGYIHNFYSSFPQDLSQINQENLAKQGMIDNILKTTGLMWLLGLSVIGAPLILGLIFLRGFVIGFTVGFIIEELVLKGVALTIASILPHNLLVIPAMLLGGGATLSFGFAAFKTLLGLNQDNIYYQFLTCTLLTLVSFGLLALAAFVEAYITPVFIQLVSGFF